VQAWLPVYSAGDGSALWVRDTVQNGVQNDPAVLQVVGVPRTSVQTAQPIPRASVMDRIVQGLQGP
jgi:hypothetical protein